MGHWVVRIRWPFLNLGGPGPPRHPKMSQSAILGILFFFHRKQSLFPFYLFFIVPLICIHYFLCFLLLLLIIFKILSLIFLYYFIIFSLIFLYSFFFFLLLFIIYFSPREQANDTWQWGGCNDDIRFSHRKSKQFLDGRKSKHGDVRVRLQRHNNQVGRLVSEINPFTTKLKTFLTDQVKVTNL